MVAEVPGAKWLGILATSPPGDGYCWGVLGWKAVHLSLVVLPARVEASPCPPSHHLPEKGSGQKREEYSPGGGKQVSGVAW